MATRQDAASAFIFRKTIFFECEPEGHVFGLPGEPEIESVQRIDGECAELRRECAWNAIVSRADVWRSALCRKAGGPLGLFLAIAGNAPTAVIGIGFALHSFKIPVMHYLRGRCV
jgi:hypothetical protein